MFYENALQRVNSTEEYLNNQVERISLSVDMSQPGSPAITVISQVARE